MGYVKCLNCENEVKSRHKEFCSLTCFSTYKVKHFFIVPKNFIKSFQNCSEKEVETKIINFSKTHFLHPRDVFEKLNMQIKEI